MSRFVEHLQQLREDLDDLIYYLERKGNDGQNLPNIKQVREDLDARDPFIRVSALITAQNLLKETMELH